MHLLNFLSSLPFLMSKLLPMMKRRKETRTGEIDGKRIYKMRRPSTLEGLKLFLTFTHTVGLHRAPVYP